MPGCAEIQATFPAQGDVEAPTLTFAAKRIKGGEVLIVASNVAGQNTLNAYRRRWSIECLFGDAKTHGLNLEDTRMQTAAKLSRRRLSRNRHRPDQQDRLSTHRQGKAGTQDPRALRKVLVPYWFRRGAKAPQKQPNRRPRSMGLHPEKERSRVVWGEVRGAAGFLLPGEKNLSLSSPSSSFGITG